MIVAEDATHVMPPVDFLAYMLAPSLLSWVATTFVIQRFWLASKASPTHNGPAHAPLPGTEPGLAEPDEASKCAPPCLQPALNAWAALSPRRGAVVPSVASPGNILSPRRRRAQVGHFFGCSHPSTSHTPHPARYTL